MADSWIQIFFAYPTLFLASIYSVIGIFAKKPILFVLGSIISLPPSYSLESTPAVRYFGYGLPLFHLLAAHTFLKQKSGLPMGLLLPFIGCMFWIVGEIIS